MPSRSARCPGLFFKVPRLSAHPLSWSDEQVGDFHRMRSGSTRRSLLVQLTGTSSSTAIRFTVPAPETLPKIFEVVDGQQRLATLLLTLSEIGRALTEAKG